MDAQRAGAVATANTARQVLGILDRDGAGDQALRLVRDKALARAQAGAGPGPEILLYVFDFQDRMLIRS